MNLDSETCYRALVAHDPRFDGVFFVGVATTGIYCRTVCPARAPRADRCSFYPSAAAAERAGFRPCRRCRPELAPGHARVDAVSRLAASAAARIDEGALAEGGVAGLAAELGVSERHLRRAVEREFGVSPVQLAQTQRLLLAKRLLTDSDLPVTEVAFASGFASLRRFNALFRERYRLNPTQLRRSPAAAPRRETLVCEVGYRPPFDWPALLRFLEEHAFAGVEAVVGDRYLRTAAIGAHRGWVTVQPAGRRPALRVEVSASLLPALRPVLARVRRLFDLAAEPRQIAAHLSGSPTAVAQTFQSAKGPGPLSALVAARPGLRVPGAFDGFELAVRTVLGQQVSVRAATTLAGRFAAAFGEPIETSFPELNRLTPTAARVVTLTQDDIASLGIVGARARALVALAESVAARRVRLEPHAGVEETIAALEALPGIGPWTAQYVALRALSWPDAFPHGDLGLRRALGVDDPADLLRAAEAWRPWRAYAAMHLWTSLGDAP